MKSKQEFQQLILVLRSPFHTLAFSNPSNALSGVTEESQAREAFSRHHEDKNIKVCGHFVMILLHLITYYFM